MKAIAPLALKKQVLNTLKTLEDALSTGYKSSEDITALAENEAYTWDGKRIEGELDCKGKSLLILIGSEGLHTGEKAEHKENMPGEAENLLKKMVEAMGISYLNDVLLVFSRALPPLLKSALPKAIVYTVDSVASGAGSTETDNRNFPQGLLSAPYGLPATAIDHPAIILRREDLKRRNWENLKALMGAIGAEK